MMRSVHVRIGLAMLMTAVVFVAIVLWADHERKNILADHFQSLAEDQSAVLNRIVQLNSDPQRALAYDYSRWDEMMQFVSSRNRKWASENLDPAIGNYAANFIWICTLDFDPIYTASNLNLIAPPNLSKTDLNLAIEGDHKRPSHFFVETAIGPVEIWGAPIRPTLDTLMLAQPSGYFLVGKLWGATCLGQLAGLLSADVKIVDSLRANPQRAVSTSDGSRVIVTKPLRGADGHPVAYLEATSESSGLALLATFLRHQRDLTTVFTFLLMAGIGLLLYVWVWKPLRVISRGISRRDTASLEPLLARKDEFSRLAGLLVEAVSHTEHLESQVQERRRAEDELRRAKNFLYGIIDSVADPIFVKDENHVYVAVNAAYCKVLGKSRADVVGRGDHDFFPNDQVDVFWAKDDEVFATEEQNENEESITYPSGEVQAILTKKALYQDPVSGERFLVGLIHDITDRKRSEVALLAAKNYAENLIETANAIVLGLDVEGRVQIFNRTAEQITGYSREELRGRNWFEMAVPRDRYPEVWEAFRNVATDGLPKHFENPILTKSGEVRHIVWSNSELLQQGRIVGSISFGIDVTAGKRVEEERAKFMTVIDEAPEAIAILDADGIIMYVNRTFEKWVGLERAELAGTYYEALARKFLANKVYSVPWDKISSGDTWLDTVAFEGGNGEYRLLDQSISPIRSPEGKVLNYVLFSRDVTEERELEIRARWADERLRLSIDGMIDGLTLWNVELTATGEVDRVLCSEANASALQILGKSREEIIGRKIGAVMSGVQDYDLRELFLRVVNRGRPLIVEHLHFVRGSEKLILTLHLWTVGTGVACHLRDVTKQLELESQLRQSQKLEAVGSLASGIAHEINTPIQFVGDNIRFVADSFKDLIEVLERHRECRERMVAVLGEHEEIVRLRELEKRIDVEYLKTEIPAAVTQSLEGVSRVATIVRAMKDFSHRDEREMVAADINEMLETTLTVARNELKYVADVKKDFDQSLPLVECFRNDLNQVFLNLLVNAAHAIGDVVGDSGERGTITVKTYREQDRAVIAISDTGCGIPDAIRDRVFEHFFTTKDVGRGTGQGLSIARNIVVERHQGTISFNSEVGKGTTFFIRLPITKEESKNANAKHLVRG